MKRSGEFLALAATITTSLFCVSASESRTDLSGEVRFHGDYLSPLLKESPERQVVDEQDLSAYINELLGLAASSGAETPSSFASKATANFLLDKPQSVALIILDSRTPRSPKDADAFSLPFQPSADLACFDTACLMRGILRAPHTQLPLTTVDLGGYTEVSFLTPHYNRQTLDNSISDAERNVQLLDGRLPESLKGVASIQEKSPSQVTITLLKERPQGVSSDTLTLEVDSQCTALLLAELKAVDLGLKTCLYAELQNVAPLLCAAHPRLAVACFESVGNTEAVAVAFFLMKEAAENLLRKDLSVRRPMVIAVSVLADNVAPSLAQKDFHLSVARRPSRCGWGKNNMHPPSIFFKRMLNDPFEADEGLAVQLDDDPRVHDTDDTDDSDDDASAQTLTPAEREQKAVFAHIILWTSIVIVFSLIYVIYVTMAMTNVKDPLLYTKMATS